MKLSLTLAIGLALIILQALIGARAFFPDAFATNEDAILKILENKKTVLDRLTAEDIGFIMEQPEIIVGVDPNFYPVEMFDERGRYTGIGGDYLRLLARMTNLRFKPVALTDWAATEQKAKQGEVDMFMAIAKTGRRGEYLLFTEPYLSLPGIIMTRRGGGLEKADIPALAGKKVAVVRDYSWHDFLREKHPEITAIPCATTLDALEKVVKGEADAIIDYEFNLLEKIQTGGIMQLQTAGHIGSDYGHAIATRKPEGELFHILATALAQINPRERKIIAQKWLEQTQSENREKHLQWLFFFFTEAILLCLGLLWLFNRKVKMAVSDCQKGCLSNQN